MAVDDVKGIKDNAKLKRLQLKVSYAYLVVYHTVAVSRIGKCMPAMDDGHYMTTSHDNAFCIWTEIVDN